MKGYHRAPVWLLIFALVAFATLAPQSAGAGPLGKGLKGAPRLSAELRRQLIALGSAGELFYQPNASVKRHIVVLPSLNFNPERMAQVKDIDKYETRTLWPLLMANSRTRISVVTSRAVDKAVLDYYFDDLMPKSQARQWVEFYNAGDGRSLALSRKLLEQKSGVLQELKQRLGQSKDEAQVLWPFITKAEEWQIAQELGIGILGPPPQQEAFFGSKTGSKYAFAKARIKQPKGAIGLRNVEQLVEQIDKLVTNYRRQIRRSLFWQGRLDFERAFVDATKHPEKYGIPKKAVVKVEDGAAGQGNALLSLAKLYRYGKKGRRAQIEAELRQMVFGAEHLDWSGFSRLFDRDGGIVEVFVPNVSSPSAQVMITADGRVRLLSTHGQRFLDKEEQVYTGCYSLGKQPYLNEINRAAHRVGKVLAKAGVRGRFAIDFVVGQDHKKRWQANAIEINLRSGGTTHPYEFARLLTKSRYDEKSGLLRRIADNQEVHYVSEDNFIDERLKTMTPAQVIAAAKATGEHYSHETMSGVALNTVETAATHGKIGFTAIGTSRAQAEKHFASFKRAFLAQLAQHSSR
ncbi:MAG: hypothetical protein H6707_17145 [Deltaproteobacteria bacterium]|nr:hypothetical protein [Deltaproteobacteria bacterium]